MDYEISHVASVPNSGNDWGVFLCPWLLRRVDGGGSRSKSATRLLDWVREPKLFPHFSRQGGEFIGNAPAA
jgi:hypothetical protein